VDRSPNYHPSVWATGYFEPEKDFSCSTRLNDYSRSRCTGLVHSLEQGKGAGLFRLILSIAVVIVLALAYVVLQFRGLSTSAGIDQAQIARELSRGHGFSTKDIRPIEAKLLEKNLGQVPSENLPDLYHAPLNPVVNAGVLYVVSSLFHLKTDHSDPVYRGDRCIAALSVAFFLLAVFVNFRLAQLLFDRVSNGGVEEGCYYASGEREGWRSNCGSGPMKNDGERCGTECRQAKDVRNLSPLLTTASHLSS
jgi:hypothetical protein